MRSAMVVFQDVYFWKIWENAEKTIKIKEKNSNNDNKKDIQSNDTEKEEEVFKSSSELNLKEGKIKEDLIKVLNISIGDIEID